MSLRPRPRPSAAASSRRTTAAPSRSAATAPSRRTTAAPSRRARASRLTALSAGLALALLAGACSDEANRTLAFGGPDEGELLNAEQLEAAVFTVDAEFEGGGEDEQPSLDDLVFALDGEDVTDEVDIQATSASWDPTELPDGDRVLTVSSYDPDPEAEEEVEPDLLHQWTFEVMATPPEIELSSPDGPVVAGDELIVAGATTPGATVQVGDRSVEAGEDGGFEVALDQAPDGALEIVATDAAGNSSDDEVTLVTVPSRAHADEIRTVHVSFCGWVSPSLKEPILEQAEQGLITAVQLDLKDETGKVGYDTEVEFASRIGSDTPDCRIDLEAAIEELHGLGLPVIGRIVAFADPVLAPWAFANGEEDMAMQTESGDIYTGRYAGFANFAHPEVVEYNLALAEEAAAMGVDHILWDYIRKPDGDGARFPGLEGDPQDAIVDFTRQASERISPYGTLHGASVYGVSADRPAEVAQNIPRMAEHLDYVAPMLYPSHWGPGEYGVADPLRQPYDMLANSLEIWLESVEGTDTRVIPWLEDSNYPVSLGYPDRGEYVREQIRATYDAGINEWLLWDSAVRYTTSAMTQPSDD